MSNEASKNFNAMLQSSKDMPKIPIITDKKEALRDPELFRFEPIPLSFEPVEAG